MNISDPVSEERARQAFKILNRFMIILWRLGLGIWFRWPKVFGCIMIITHRGRKTGLRRQTPVNFTILEGDIFFTAAFGSKSDWYWNILENPEVEVWLPDGWWTGIAEKVQDSEARTEILRQVLIASGFAASAFGLNPYEISEDALLGLLDHYQLMRIKRVEARTGPGGPGEFAWIWQVLASLLIPLVFFKSRRKKARKE